MEIEETSQEYDIDSRCDMLMSYDHSLVGGFLYLSDQPLDLWGPVDDVVVRPQDSFNSDHISWLQTRSHEQGETRHNTGLVDRDDFHKDLNDKLTTAGPKIARHEQALTVTSTDVPQLPELSPLFDFYWPWNWNYAPEWNRQILRAKQFAELLAIEKKRQDMERKKVENQVKKSPYKISEITTGLRNGKLKSELKEKDFPRPKTADPDHKNRRKFYSLEETRQPRPGSECRMIVNTPSKQPFFREIQLQDLSSMTYSNSQISDFTDKLCRIPTDQKAEQRELIFQSEPQTLTTTPNKSDNELPQRPDSSKSSTMKPAVSKRPIHNKVTCRHVKARIIQVQAVSDQATDYNGRIVSRAKTVNENELGATDRLDDKVSESIRKKRQLFGQNLRKAFRCVRRGIRSVTQLVCRVAVKTRVLI